jgi:hypothetical protein
MKSKASPGAVLPERKQNMWIATLARSVMIAAASSGSSKGQGRKFRALRSAANVCGFPEVVLLSMWRQGGNGAQDHLFMRSTIDHAEEQSIPRALLQL